MNLHITTVVSFLTFYSDSTDHLLTRTALKTKTALQSRAKIKVDDNGEIKLALKQSIKLGQIAESNHKLKSSRITNG